MQETIFSQALIADLDPQQLAQFDEYVTKDVKTSSTP